MPIFFPRLTFSDCLKNISHIVFSIVLILALISCNKQSNQIKQTPPNGVSTTASRIEIPDAEKNPKPEKPPEPPHTKPEVIPPSPTLQKELRDYVNRWNELPSQFSGKDLITKQRELAYEALGKLAGGVELTQFLQFLKNKGAADLCQEIIDGGMVDLFRGEKGDAMRNWVIIQICRPDKSCYKKQGQR